MLFLKGHASRASTTPRLSTDLYSRVQSASIRAVASPVISRQLDAGGLSGSGTSVGRTLRAMDTDEETQRLIKRQKLLELRGAVQRAETEVAQEASKVAGGAVIVPADRRFPEVPQTSADVMQILATSLDPGCFTLPDVLTVPSNP